MREATVIFPHQLFESTSALSLTRPVFLIEDFLFFRVQTFHKQRLVLLRAAMRRYADHLRDQGLVVHYIDSSALDRRGAWFNKLVDDGITHLHLIDVVDDWLLQDITKAQKTFDWTIQWHYSPQFLNTDTQVREFFQEKKRFSQAQFYAHQRRSLDILMSGDSPVGGKFSFDVENRKKLGKDVEIPPRLYPKPNPYVEEAVNYVNVNFSEAIGMAEPFRYATTFDEAKEQLADFIVNRLSLFGPFEDAISTREDVIFHSVLSPLLNIGLLTPKQVIDGVLAYAETHEVPPNSLEGFVRQVIGWREYVRACYVLGGSFQRSSNVFKHTRPLPKGFWNGETGIVPVDTVIKRLLETGYCHHIERLMILGNFLLLTETSPDEVYRWFMAYFVDSYDWVMVPNVYGMSQFADGGFMTTKPYISGSNYIFKMSDHKKGEWVDIWDGLFWRFLSKNRKLFSSNPRTQMLLTMLGTKEDSIQPKILKAESWLNSHCPQE